MLVRITSIIRMAVSGKIHSAHSVPITVIPAVVKKMPVVERPAFANEPPAREPNRMPVKTQVLETEITAPRRSGGDFHWRMAFKDTKMNALEIPRAPNKKKVPMRRGFRMPSRSSARNTPMAPKGISPYSTRFREILPTNMAPIPIPTDSTVSGSPDCASESWSTAFA